MACEDYWLAHKRWVEYTSDDPRFGVFVDLQPHYVNGWGWSFISVSDETARRVELLTGPNWKTIIKVYLIKASAEAA